MGRPNVLFIMCDQLRADSIGAAGNSIVKTPNIDRLAERGILFTKAYSTCPVCVPARYIIRTGCEPYNTGVYQNGAPVLAKGQEGSIEERCGKYLARTMKELGYRTFGIGKFHTEPNWDEDLGYEVHLYSEELYNSPEQRKRDSYASFIAKEHPAFGFIEQMHGERTEMYYMPQMSPLPAELTVEAWAADRAVEQISREDERPYFGFVSFIGPHPPFAPPVPYNRMYDPDIMPEPLCGEVDVDHMDEHLPYMNYLIWAEDINTPHARALKARYYGEITYIDSCIGRIMDAVEKNGDMDNTLICLFSDHGDHLGDHRSWQKESFFESSCNIPFIVSWPAKLAQGEKHGELVSLTDLFGIATLAADNCQVRDGIDVLGAVEGNKAGRQYLYGYYGIPGTRHFKMMVREKDWKYIYMANGGREQLFNVTDDPDELKQQLDKHPCIAQKMRAFAVEEVKRRPALTEALDGDSLKRFEFSARQKTRIHQFDTSKDIKNFTYSSTV